MVPDHEIDSRHLSLAAVEGPQGVDPFQGRRQRRHRSRRQGHANVAADSGRVPDLERREEGAAALVDQKRRRPVRAPGEGVEIGDSAGGGDAETLVADLERLPTEAMQIDQAAEMWLRLREEPGTPCQPTVAVPPGKLPIGGGRCATNFLDRVQVHGWRLRARLERSWSSISLA